MSQIQERDPRSTNVTLGGEPDVFRVFKTMTDMAVAKYGIADNPYHGHACYGKWFKETYALYCPRCGFVKFGGSDHTAERVRRVSAEHRRKCKKYFDGLAPWPLPLLGTFEGNQQELLRKKFGLLRIRHEWFVYTDEIRRYLMEQGWPKLPDLPAWTPEQRSTIIDRLRRRLERGKIP
jgi:hypothetical protein